MDNLYTVSVQNVQSFLMGQLELYKIEFIQTSDNKYLEVMNNINITNETIKKMDNTIRRLTKENLELKK